MSINYCRSILHLIYKRSPYVVHVHVVVVLEKSYSLHNVYAGPNLGSFCGCITAISPHKIRAKIPLFSPQKIPLKFVFLPLLHLMMSITWFHLYDRYRIDFGLKMKKIVCPLTPIAGSRCFTSLGSGYTLHGYDL